MNRSLFLLLWFPWQLWAQSSQPTKIGLPTWTTPVSQPASQPADTEGHAPIPEAKPLSTKPLEQMQTLEGAVALLRDQTENPPRPHRVSKPQVISLLAAPLGLGLTGIAAALGNDTQSIARKSLALGVGTVGLSMMIVGPSYSHLKAKEWGRAAGFSAARVSAVGLGTFGALMATTGLLVPILDGFTEDGDEPSGDITFADTRGLVVTGAALTIAGGVLFTSVRAWVFADGKRALQRSEVK